MRALICWVTAALMLLAGACSKDSAAGSPAPEPPFEGEAQQTMMFFFIGTSLESFFDANIEQARSVFDGEMARENRVVMFCHRDNRWQIAELRHHRHTGTTSLETLKEFPLIDRNAPGFISQVISEMQALAPARHYGLVFGGHGSGWLPKGLPLSRSRTHMTTHDAWGNPYPLTRAFGEPGSIFDIGEIAAEINATGTRLDYLIFDDCFMSNIETLYIMRHSARYILASPCEVMGDGFPYKYVVPAVMRKDTPLYDRLAEVCRKYHSYYNGEYDPHYKSGCIALTVCDELEALAAATRPVLTAPLRPYDRDYLQTYEGFSRHLFYDFRQYVESVATDEGRLQAYRVQFDRTFPKELRLHTERFYSNWHPQELLPIDYYSGVTCSEPAQRHSEANRQTEWWQATH